MPKQISLKKVWHLCNTSIKNNMSRQYVLSAQDAYCLYLKTESESKTQLLKKFGAKLKENNFENLCIYIESFLNLPVRDGDFLVLKNDKITAQDKKSQLIFYLHNIRSGFNIGSMIRLADGFHIQKVILSGYTAPIDNSQVQRAALGAENHILIEHDNTHFDLLKKYKEENYNIVGLETIVNSKNIYNYEFKQNTLIIVGNERHGLKEETLQFIDDAVHIPMYGTKNSLNVTSALSIASYEWSKQWR